MVSSQKEEIFRILDFVWQKKNDTLDRMFSSIDIVSQEKVVWITWLSTSLEKG